MRSWRITMPPSGAGCCGCWANATDAVPEADKAAVTNIPSTLFISSFLSLNKTYGVGQAIGSYQDIGFNVLVITFHVDGQTKPDQRGASHLHAHDLATVLHDRRIKIAKRHEVGGDFVIDVIRQLSFGL